MWRVIYGLRYFSLRNSEKSRLDLVPTAILCLILAGPFLCWPDAAFFMKDGFVDKVLTLTSALTGFYTAALVAAATFSHPDLDRAITAGPIVLVEKGADGQAIQRALTRRQFACYIFGYLAFSSLMISLFGALAIALSARDWAALGSYALWLRGTFVLVFSIAIAHMATATGLGLYYLMDRLYRNDRVVRRTKAELDRVSGNGTQG